MSLRPRLAPSASVRQRAQVRVCAPMNEAEVARLGAALEQYFHTPVTLDVELAPEILGGVWVRVGDTVMDGTLAGRLEALRQHLCAQCRIMVTSGVSLGTPEHLDGWMETPE